MIDPFILQRVTTALDERLKQYALDREPMNPKELAQIALTISTQNRLPSDIVIARRR